MASDGLSSSVVVKTVSTLKIVRLAQTCSEEEGGNRKEGDCSERNSNEPENDCALHSGTLRFVSQSKQGSFDLLVLTFKVFSVAVVSGFDLAN